LSGGFLGCLIDSSDDSDEEFSEEDEEDELSEALSNSSTVLLPKIAVFFDVIFLLFFYFNFCPSYSLTLSVF
jgi:hypothetical protein